MPRPLSIALYALPLLALTALVVWLALALAPGRDPSTLPSALIDKPAPALDLPSIHPDRPGLSAADLKGRAGIDWGVYGVPETYVVDAEGRIRYKHVGPLSEEDLEGVILPVLRKVKG